MIKIRGLSKYYDPLQVLDALDLDIETGETMVVLGQSGVGKSVLLKHIIGITKPDAGYVDVDGVRVTDLVGVPLYKAIKEMGMLFQMGALFDSMDIRGNTAFYLHQHNRRNGGNKIAESEIQDRVEQALEMVGLSGTEKKMPADLSGGMKKRAALARLIVYRPKILLYDEPTTGLDPITAMQINELIVKTQQELKATSIVVTHDIVSSLYVADRLALIEKGKIKYIDKPDPFMAIDDPTIEFLRKTISQDPREFRRDR